MASIQDELVQFRKFPVTSISIRSKVKKYKKPLPTSKLAQAKSGAKFLKILRKR